MDAVLYSSRSEEWGTPQAFFDSLNAEFGFTLDAAASKENAKCDRYYTKEENGLWLKWEASTYLNPPYGTSIGTWMAKAEREATWNTVVCLVPARTDTEWFHRSVWGRASELRFVRGRLRFEGGENSATFPSVVIIYRPNDHACRVSTIGKRGERLWSAECIAAA
jgi:site-specific DNA-methyltransferase (adenine-specific)